MKLFIEHYGNEFSAKISDDASAVEVALVFSGLMKQAGLSFNGDLEIVNHTEPDED